MFQAKLERLFIIPANTFDNVSGQFPIGFHIWDTDKKERFEEISADVYDKDGNFLKNKDFYCYDKEKGFISDWILKYTKNIAKECIGNLAYVGSDFQNQSTIFIGDISKTPKNGRTNIAVSKENLIFVSIFFAVRHCIPADWLNDRDQFLYPNDSWETDDEFQSDCLAYTLFHGQNNISCKHGTNHWIPFIEWDVGAHDKFDSHFMTDFIAGKIDLMLHEPSIFYNAGACTGGGGGADGTASRKKTRLKFSETARDIFKAGKELWKYYHSQKNANPNAAFYDIREHFQGRNAQGRMNAKSDDEKYNELLGDLREALRALAKKIEPKVYEHGFLKA